jgi:hypothetical protein
MFATGTPLGGFPGFGNSGSGIKRNGGEFFVGTYGICCLRSRSFTSHYRIAQIEAQPSCLMIAGEGNVISSTCFYL